jgi:hypothetical protein
LLFYITVINKKGKKTYSNMIGYEKWIPDFDVKNISLSMLASEAALDISNLISGRSAEDESIQYLARILKETTKGEFPQALSPENNLVLGYSISGRKNAQEFWEGRRTEDVLLQTWLAAKNLKEIKSLPTNLQEELSDFCSNLSTESMIAREEYYPSRNRLIA